MKKLTSIAVLSLLLNEATVAASFKKPIAEINVAGVSEPYQASHRVYPFLAGINLEFLGEERLALSSLDGQGQPKDGVMPQATFHLTIDVFDLQNQTLKAAAQLRFATETSDSYIAALPSGRLIVAPGGRHKFFKNFFPIVSATYLPFFISAVRPRFTMETKL